MKKVLLMILDGWGIAPASDDNAITLAKTPNWNYLITNSLSKNSNSDVNVATGNNIAYSNLQTSGSAVGLPDDQMGNSEVGHMNIGAGRIVYQSLTRIQKAVDEHGFNDTPNLVAACEIPNNNALHIIGLLSDGGVHSHIDHIISMINLAKSKKVSKVYFHAILDGRDTAPRSAKNYLEQIISLENEQFKIASIIGRYYAMDRDNNWDRVEQAYKLIINSDSIYAAVNSLDGLQQAYQRNENDEFVKPTRITSAPIKDGDSIVIMNFRADRAREITKAIYEDDFSGFSRRKIDFAHFVTLTKYQDDFKAKVAFAPELLTNGLGETVSSHNLNQLRIAETEKYAHVTYFFNGGIEKEFPNEDRCLIPSPSVATYDLKPEMSAYEVTDNLISAIKSNKYSFVCVNYANPDMVGHTGIIDAAIKAVETVDNCLGKVLTTAKENQMSVLITADHGNVEDMLDEKTLQAITSHTMNPVPLVYVNNNDDKIYDLKNGALCDLAPTILEILGIEKPDQMTGKSLLVKK